MNSYQFNVDKLTINQPANGGQINDTMAAINMTFPNVYKNLLKITNGLSNQQGLVIYGTNDITERNETWEVEQYATGYVAIGDDSGGNVFLMLQREEETRVISVDTGDMNPEHGIEITPNFAYWINNGCVIDEKLNPLSGTLDTCNVILLAVPSEGLKGLIKIKNILGINISTPELLKGSKNLPFILAENFPYSKAKKLIEKLDNHNEIINLSPIK